jgi:hypothetical protein
MSAHSTGRKTASEIDGTPVRRAGDTAPIRRAGEPRANFFLFTAGPRRAGP